MTGVSASIGSQAGQSFGDFVPRLGGAVALLVVGLLIVRVLARVLTRALVRAGLDDLGARVGANEVLGRVGLAPSLARLTSRAVRVLLALVVIFAAASLLGLQFLSQALNSVLLFIPNLIAAVALVLVGVLAGEFVRRRTDRLAFQMNLSGPLGQVARAAVVAVFAVLALGEIGVAVTILVVALAIVGGVAGLTGALAFGLGGRDMAREVSAGRYVSSAYEPGQTITLDGLTGRIVEIETTATTLQTDDGERVRVPNHLFLEHPVRTPRPVPGGSEPSAES